MNKKDKLAQKKHGKNRKRLKMRFLESLSLASDSQKKSDSPAGSRSPKADIKPAKPTKKKPAVKSTAPSPQKKTAAPKRKSADKK